MTYRERVKQAREADVNATALDKIIAYAYYQGCEETARVAGDKMESHLRQQHTRARACRYHLMAAEVVGPETIIYLPDYAGTYSEAFGSDACPADL